LLIVLSFCRTSSVMRLCRLRGILQVTPLVSIASPFCHICVCFCLQCKHTPKVNGKLYQNPTKNECNDRANGSNTNKGKMYMGPSLLGTSMGKHRHHPLCCFAS